MPSLKVPTCCLLVALAATLLAGCRTQARRVDCDGSLRPINVPAPVSVPAPAVKPEGTTP